jgi:hypothetical protein
MNQRRKYSRDYYRRIKENPVKYAGYLQVKREYYLYKKQK